jgi:archaellum component FlaC
MDNKELFALAAIGISVFSLLVNYFNRRGDDVIGVKKEVGEIDKRLVRLETQFEYVTRKAAEILHRPTHWELDQLIEKFLNHRLSDDEREHFIEMLEDVTQDKDTAPGYRGVAAILAANLLGEKMAEEKSKGAA